MYITEYRELFCSNIKNICCVLDKRISNRYPYFQWLINGSRLESMNYYYW